MPLLVCIAPNRRYSGLKGKESTIAFLSLRISLFKLVSLKGTGWPQTHKKEQTESIGRKSRNFKSLQQGHHLEFTTGAPFATQPITAKNYLSTQAQILHRPSDRYLEAISRSSAHLEGVDMFPTQKLQQGHPCSIYIYTWPSRENMASPKSPRLFWPLNPF